MRRCRPVVSPLVALLAASGALAQGSPWTIGVSQAFAHESNVYHLADGDTTPAGASRSDTISTTALLGGLDLLAGRQRLYGSATLRANRFSSNEHLDSDGYALNLGADWQTVEHLSGSVDLRADRNLARFDTDTELGDRVQGNVETSQQAKATVRVGVITAYTGEAGLEYRRVDYSSAAFESRENHQTTGTLGLLYRPSGATTLGIGLRHARGKYPRFGIVGGEYLADTFTHEGVDLTVAVDATGASQLYARATFGRTRYDQATQRDFSGVTGALVWRYEPGGRLKLNTRLARDSGQNSYFAAASGSEAFTDFSRTTTSLRVRSEYEISAKIALMVTAFAAERDLVRTSQATSSLPADATGSDQTARLALGLSWVPTRALSFGCDVGHERRRVTGALSKPYRASSAACKGEFALR